MSPLSGYARPRLLSISCRREVRVTKTTNTLETGHQAHQHDERLNAPVIKLLSIGVMAALTFELKAGMFRDNRVRPIRTIAQYPAIEWSGSSPTFTKPLRVGPHCKNRYAIPIANSMLKQSRSVILQASMMPACQGSQGSQSMHVPSNNAQHIHQRQERL